MDVSAVSSDDNVGRGQYIKRPWLDDGLGDERKVKRIVNAATSVVPAVGTCPIEFQSEPLDLSGWGRVRNVQPTRPRPYWCAICRDLVGPPDTRVLGAPNATPFSVASNATVPVIGQIRNVLKGRMMANARERVRARMINAAFEKLRSNIPKPVGDQKMSKLMTIELATSYINYLTMELGRRYRGNLKALPIIPNKRTISNSPSSKGSDGSS